MVQVFELLTGLSYEIRKQRKHFFRSADVLISGEVAFVLQVVPGSGRTTDCSGWKKDGISVS
jgi:hypothetical protein